MSYYDHATMTALGLDPRIVPPAHDDLTDAKGSLRHTPRAPFSRWFARITGRAAATPAASGTPATRRERAVATRATADAATP